MDSRWWSALNAAKADGEMVEAVEEP